MKSTQSSNLQHYIGTKIVRATPMTYGAYKILRGSAATSDEAPEDPGYLVEHLDGGKPNHPDFAGYISWCPKGVFENANTHIHRIDENPRLLEQEWTLRVAGELSLLERNMSRLKAMFETPAILERVSAIQRKMLRIQLKAMNLYREILIERLH